MIFTTAELEVECEARTAASMDNVQAQKDTIRAYLEHLDLPASTHILEHAATFSHEDMPHNHECGFDCSVIESRGTITPPSSVSSEILNDGPQIKIDNFGIVLPGAIYRSRYPKPINYGYIKTLNIKSILTLVPEPIAPEYQAFMSEAGIQHFQVHIKANKGQVSTESCEMSRTLRLVMDRANHPILIHCNKGKHRTGCTVACFRRILGLPMDEIIDEYHNYAGAKARLMDEVFFEGFDLNLVMWVAKQQGWVAPAPQIAPPSPPTSLKSTPIVAKPQA
ncbi:hypothetical protein EK21DRAFT_106900 [Setomelanomma holmii]|uniref:Uncharacterized protein n=1 Tax=Setomelanomma holmii TaxID=210430 RepID=A0A9P4HLW0_9PLEO|nr:hypothetical protein EK21DRAFT_106900 [Setomelanomma holmii]